MNYAFCYQKSRFLYISINDCFKYLDQINDHEMLKNPFRAVAEYFRSVRVRARPAPLACIHIFITMKL